MVWVKRFISQMVAMATTSAVKTWVWPLVAPLVSTVIGLFEKFSLFYLWIGGVLAAAGGAGFLVWTPDRTMDTVLSEISTGS